MKTDKNRADRILIGIALIIILMAGGAFYFDGWMWGDRRDRGDRIGVIADKSGDVRVKFEGDLRWDKAARGQDLMYNDSIYSGNGSEAKLQLGESEMTVTENTLVVLRRENLINFLNLNYGTLFGKLGKNEKVIIDTGDGKPVELSTKDPAQIVLSKKNGQLKLDVVSGTASVVVDGKKNIVDQSSSIILDAKTPPKIEKASLLAVKPLKDQVIYSEQPMKVDFQWAWSQARPARPEETYTLEFSAQPSFEKVLTTKVVKGELASSMQVSQSLSLWYRVRGPKGELTPIERINFVRLQKPVIVRPVVMEKYQAPLDKNALVEFEFRTPKGSEVLYQVASDPDFGNILANQSTPEAKAYQELAVGQYFIRARANFGENRLTEWTQTVPFSVDPKLLKMQLPQVPTLSRILIPNRAYPVRLYGAAHPQVRDYLAKKGFLRDFFPFAKDSFDELKIQFEGEKQPSVVQDNSGWPVKKIYPGRYKFQYQVSKSGFAPQELSSPKKLEIAMEPPMAIGEAQFGNADKDGKRDVQWKFTPLLFAATYDVEIAENRNFMGASQLNVPTPEINTPLAPGQYFWRARARDNKGRIISDFSSAKPLEVPVLTPVMLAKRDPQNVEKTVTKKERVKGDQWEKSGWWAWLGSGMNFVDYRQSITDRTGPGLTTSGTGSLDSSNIKGPSQFFETGYTGNNGWGGVVSYKSTPGTMLITNVPIREPDYTWSTISLEGIMRRTSSYQLFKIPVVYGLRLGVQQHKTPFVHVDQFGEPLLRTNEMSTASLGVLAEWARNRWKYYWLMRYQFPLAAQASGASTFEINPTFAFDGSLGSSYNLTRQLKLGLFWYGQWHQYNFKYSESTISNGGFQSLFYSNMDLRLGFDF